MRQRWNLSVVTLIACVAGLSVAAAQSTDSRPSQVGLIDESSLVSLTGNRHPLAVAANDRGGVDSSLPLKRMLLVLKRDEATESALLRFLADQQDKSSPNYHAWLSPEQFSQRFGTPAVDLQKTAAWLRSHGFSVDSVGRGGTTIEFHGSAGQVQEAFHTEIHRYLVNGKSHFANATDPQIPTALATVVAGIDTLHNFEKPSAIRALGPASRIGNSSAWQPDFTYNPTGTPFHYLAPGDFAKIYNTAALYQSGIDGTGETIAIVARNNINLSDIEIFRLAFGLSANNPQIILNGPDPGNALGSGDETEADLDTEWSGAIAPKATINLVVSASTNATDGVDLSAQYIVDNNLAPVMSMSYGECESSMGQAENTFYSNLWEQAAAEGITAVVASGDSGEAGCDSPLAGPATQGAAVNGVASTPFNIAVGGTEFNENGADSSYWAATNGPDQSSALGYIPEAVWNESCGDPTQCSFVTLYASGGGASGIYAKPSWQSGTGVPPDGKRDLPDVSLDAAAQHDGYLICQDGICLTDANGQLIDAYVVGGTSASTPTFAAIMALVNQKLNSRQGQANFVLYLLAASQNAANCNASTGPHTSCIFNDITQGNNNVPGQTGSAATLGYDLATGLGSVNAANLVASWNSISFRPTSIQLQVTPATITHGQDMTVTATVAPTSGTGTPTGDVVLLGGGTQSVNLGSLSGGSVSAPIASLPGGNYSLTANYGGDGTFGASVSTGVPVTISPEASTLTFTTLDASMSPNVSTTYSNYFYFQVAAKGASGQGVATGTVSFSDTFNGTTTSLPATRLNSQGNALVLETGLAVGSHNVTATYSGDASFTASSAKPVAVTVSTGQTQTILLIPTGALPNSSVTLQAIVLANGLASPTGTVQFESGSTALGSPVTLIGQIATLITTQLTSGPNTITAVYSGDSNFNGSTSTPETLVIGNPDFQIGVNPGTLTISSNSPGKTTLLLSPAPGLGFAGSVSLSCSGLPTGSGCSFQPPQVVLDGFDPATATVIISEPASHALPGLAKSGFQTTLFSLFGAVGVFTLVLLPSPAKKKKRCRKLYRTALLACLIALGMGCGGGNGSSPATQPTPPVVTSSNQSYTVVLTASGGSGSTAVSHSVSMQVTFQ